jgi:hypothetical protein
VELDVTKKGNLHIRNRHTQKTQPPRSEKVERKREHVFIRISISNLAQQILFCGLLLQV